jgi:hypothetical protein
MDPAVAWLRNLVRTQWNVLALCTRIKNAK